ncbi:MAG: hypothetical protein R2690_06820 [Acidimicrobiales bacterium]
MQIQLMAEVLYVHLLILMTIRDRKKRSTINEVLRWMSNPVTIPDDLDAALDPGL